MKSPKRLRKNNEVRRFLIILIITILISFSLSVLFYFFYIIQDVQELDMEIKVGGIVGIDVNTSVISFGIVPMGDAGVRPVVLKNTKNKPLKVYIKKSGEMAPWVYVSENNFILQPNEKKEIKFQAALSEDVEFGKYTGKVKFIFKRVIFS